MNKRIKEEIFKPDRMKLERYRRAPQQGPKILFFSGGTALRDVCRELTRYTHNSIHILTPFDSGGSTGEIRRRFGMPAMGDIRNRLMALAHPSVKEKKAIAKLFSHRFSLEETQEEVIQELLDLADGTHPLIRKIPDAIASRLRSYFQRFLEAMPAKFDLRGACMGNLILTTEYLASSRQMTPVIDLFSKLARVYGIVRPVVPDDMHLVAELANGSVIVGQHLLSGKEAPPIQSKITRVWLTRNLNSTIPAKVAIQKEMEDCIGMAELICFPIGSFYSSVVANILPEGVGKAVADNPCPKVFVPNPFEDPELLGHTVGDQVAVLRKYLVKSGASRAEDALHYVLLDTRNGVYPDGLDLHTIEKMGVQIIDTPLITAPPMAGIDEKLLTRALLSLI